MKRLVGLLFFIGLLIAVNIAKAASQNDFAATFINNSGETVILTNGSNSSVKLTLPASQAGQPSVAYLPKDGWLPVPFYKFVYIQVHGQSSSQTYCIDDIHGKYGDKFTLSSVWSIESGFKCSSTSFPVPSEPPVSNVTPVITNLPQSVELTEGESRQFTGSLLDSDGNATATAHCTNCSGGISVSTGSGQIILNISSSTAVGHHLTNIEAHTPNGNHLNWPISITVHERVPQAQALIPRTVSAWIYDASGSPTEPGQFVNAINRWNNESASYGNKITELHTYGTDLEMYGSQPNNNQTLHAFYVPTQLKVTSSTGVNTNIDYVGPLSVITYQQGVHDAAYMSPIVDGRTDSGYLMDFNNLSVPLAVEFADLLSMQTCLDQRVNGLQIDVEPLDFNIPPNGTGLSQGLNSQVAFYLRLADNFSSQNSNEAVITNFSHSNYSKPALSVCGDKQRYLSVFTFASKIASALSGQYKDDVNDLLSRANFLVIDSLYDLPPGTNSYEMTNPTQYKQFVIDEAEAMVALSEIYGINYKFAIPASCSFHECGPVSGKYSQVEYVKAAMEAIAHVNDPNGPNSSGRICASQHFKGIAIWAFDRNTVQWGPNTFHIQPPDQEVVNYLTHSPGMSEMLGCSLNH